MTQVAKILVFLLILTSLGEISSCTELCFHNDRYNGQGNWGPTPGALRLAGIWIICFLISLGISLATLCMRLPTWQRVCIWTSALVMVPAICFVINLTAEPAG